METKFFVVEAYRYKASGNWEYKMDGMYGSLTQAKSIFHARCSAIIKDTNDFCMVMLYDNWGNRIEIDVVDTSDPSESVLEEETEE